MPVPVTRSIVLFLVLFAGLSLAHVFDRSRQVTIDLRARAGGTAELFHRGDGDVFTAGRRVAFDVVGDGAWHRYTVALPHARSTAALRFDPPGTGEVEIGAVTVVSGRGERRVPAGSIAAGAVHLNHATLRPGTVGTVISPVGDDPYVELTLPSEGSALWLVLLRAAAAAGLALVLLPLTLPCGRDTLVRIRARLRPPAQRVARGLSDEGVLVVPPGAVLVLAGLLALATLYVALRLHQSSIGVWEWMYPAHPVAQTVDLGTAKRIRSDEWNTQTPWVLNQVQRGWPTRNASVGGERAPLLAAVPVAHPIVLGQPKFLGFALFGPDTGFSWWWAYKTFGLLAAFFWMLLVLTRGHTVAAAAGAAMVYASSFTQWWLSSNLAEILIAFAMAVTGGAYLLFARRWRGLVAGAVLSFFAVLGLVLHLYPPFIVPLAYLGVAILGGLLLEPGRAASVRVRWPARAVAVAALGLVTGALVLSYSAAVADTVQAMMGTVYPGHRIAASGGMAVDRLMYAWFEGFRFGEEHIPAGSGNASEASDYIAFVPALLLLFPLTTLARRRNALLLALLVYAALAGLWICVQLPLPVERAYQLAGWAWTPPARAVIGFGLASILATFVGFATACDHPDQLRSPALRRAVPVLCAGAVLALGLSLRHHDPAFFTWRVLAAGSMLAGLLAAALAFRSRVLLAMAVLLVAIPGLQVNPLSSGLSALLDKPVLVAAREQGSAPGDRWIVIGDFVLSQGLKAQGLDVLSGSQLVPSRGPADVLDPHGDQAAVWNRYAHVVYASDPAAVRPAFTLNQPDLYTVSLDVCGGALQRLGVTRVAYTVAVPPADLRCLAPLSSPADSGIRLFRLDPANVSRAGEAR